jgi:hypothetical protein
VFLGPNNLGRNDITEIDEELKMTKKIYEEEAKNRFLEYIERERGERWEVLAADVVTEPKIGRNFDYELYQGSRRIALEIMRLVDSKGLAEFMARYEITSAVLEELKRCVPNDRDFIFYTPPYFKVSKAHRKQFVRDLVAQLAPVARSCTSDQKVRFRGYPYTVSPYPGSGWVTSACNLNSGYPDPGEQLIQSTLRRKLPHKNRQLSVAGYERIVLIVCLEGTTRTEDVQEAISDIDFWCLPNIDKVYFESGMEQIRLVYDCSMSDLTPGGRSGKLPPGAE